MSDSLNINLKSRDQNTYDAIVIGSGITGGYAAKELCEKGLKTLVLERGRDVKHGIDYTNAMKHPWEFENRMELTDEDKATNPIQSLSYNPGSRPFYVNDQEHPYIQHKPFYWIRGYQVGGRSLTWGRQVYRLSNLDFEANAKDGYGVDWPIRYKDLEPWYKYAEDFIGVSGNADSVPHLPHGDYLPAMEMNCLEKHFVESIKENYEERWVIMSRLANLTKGYKGRGPCQYRNLCSRGCPYSGYFSSNSASLPAANATGNLTLRPHAIVQEIIYDPNTRKAKGVRIIDEITKETSEFFAKIIFINASTIATASILLNSKSSYFPDGFGNSSGQIGKNLMDHHKGIGATAEYEGFKDKYYVGRRPGGIYIPRFSNLTDTNKHPDFVRGYGFQADAERSEWPDVMKEDDSFGDEYKNKLTVPGPWTMFMGAWGECLPNPENKIWLDENKKDQWGLPLVNIQFEYGANEMAMRKDAQLNAIDMFEKTGFKNIKPFDYLNPGTTIHEMGTARMGNDPKTSVLNAHNQMHDVKNVFITDGSAMASGGCQNPSLTYMALTARACQFAVDELNKQNL